MYKIILDPGHGLNTSGKRCDKALDPNQTREWTLNSRICNYVENLLSKEYTGYEILRVDDRTGKTDVALATRVKNANTFNGDIYISVHADAGAKLTKSGGITAFAYTSSSAASKEWRDELYA